MGKKISKQTKEIINIVIFLVVVGLLLFYFVIYPLNKSKPMFGRTNIDEFNPDSLPINDASLFTEEGLKADTLLIEADALTYLATLFITPEIDSNQTETINGTVILLNSDNSDRSQFLDLTKSLIELNYKVIAYDQRASGMSGGSYRGFGYYEASDLTELLRYFELREKISHPLTVVGYETGGDAVLTAALEENRIDRVVAINPYLSTTRTLDMLKDKYDALWLPFYRSVMFWWYEHRSSLSPIYIESDAVQEISKPTLLLIDKNYENDTEINNLKSNSESELLKVDYTDQDTDTKIINFIEQGTK